MRKINEDKINALYGLVLDWSLIHAVKSHTEPYLNDRPSVDIDQVFLLMSSGKRYYSRSAHTSSHDISAVNIKLTDGSVLSIQIRRVYQVASSFALCAHERDTMKSIERSYKDWYVYVVECSDSSLYCGITVDVTRRVEEHNSSNKGSKYTRSRRPVKLLKQWKVGSQSEAMKAENRFKKLPREEKLNIVRSDT